MEFKHISVLLNESVDLLNVRQGGIYVDGTLGGGGHSALICERLSDLSGGRLIGIDRDTDAIAAAEGRLEKYKKSVDIKTVHDNFKNIKRILSELGIEKIDGAILDLGVSSYQLDEGERGFSYKYNARLDMRMDRGDALSAYEVVNGYDLGELTRIIYEYGEQRFAKRIAERIVREREKHPIETTFELNDIIRAAYPAAADKHPSKRTYQAIRIEVNRELEILEGALRDFVDVLKPGGVLAVITFHSLEDRIVKNTFSALAAGCTCPKDFPVCVCGNVPKIKLAFKKPVTARADELERNNRSHSAKLRAAIKL